MTDPVYIDLANWIRDEEAWEREIEREEEMQLDVNYKTDGHPMIWIHGMPKDAEIKIQNHEEDKYRMMTIGNVSVYLCEEVAA